MLRATGNLLLVILLISITTVASIAQESPPSRADWTSVASSTLVYEYEGRLTALSPVLDKMAVQFRDPVQGDDGAVIIAEHLGVGRQGPEGPYRAGIYIFTTGSPAASWNDLTSLLAGLNRDPRIARANPVFAVPGGLACLTDEIVIGFAEEMTAARIAQLLDAEGLLLLDTLPRAEHVVLVREKDPGNRNVLAHALAVADRQDVRFCQPNFLSIIDPFVVPNDTYFSSQWALNNTGQGGGQPGVDIGAVDAWNITTGQSAVVVAVIDEGVDLGHEDLISRLVPGFDAVDADEDPSPHSWDGHGTACAGVVAAAGNNAQGVAGVSWNSRIMPIRIAHHPAPNEHWETNDLVDRHGHPDCLGERRRRAQQ